MEAEIRNFNLFFSLHPLVSSFSKEINHANSRTQSYVIPILLTFGIFGFIFGEESVCSDQFIYNCTLASFVVCVLLNLSIFWKFYVYGGVLKPRYTKLRRSAGIWFDDFKKITEWELVMKFFLFEFLTTSANLVITLLLGGAVFAYISGSLVIQGFRVCTFPQKIDTRATILVSNGMV